MSGLKERTKYVCYRFVSYFCIGKANKFGKEIISALDYSKSFIKNIPERLTAKEQSSLVSCVRIQES